MARTGRPSDKEINSFVGEWLISQRCVTVNEAAVKKDIPQTTLESIADMEKTHKIFAQILDMSEKMGMEPGELMRGVIDGRSKPPMKRKEIADRVNAQKASHDEIAS